MRPPKRSIAVSTRCSDWSSTVPLGPRIGPDRAEPLRHWLGTSRRVLHGSLLAGCLQGGINTIKGDDAIIPVLSSADLEMASGLVAKFVRRHHGDVFKLSDRDGGPLWYEGDPHITGSVRRVDAAPGVVEVDDVTLLSVHEFNDVALRTAHNVNLANGHIPVVIKRHVFDDHIVKHLYGGLEALGLDLKASYAAAVVHCNGLGEVDGLQSIDTFLYYDWLLRAVLENWGLII
uniref:Uncharacterized protein n=1 Tax=Timema cristinae TaxID=61476 RepID=A0A7R9D0U4_TIMCR|nr:unnamed protein product [Timema cristinae]